MDRDTPDLVEYWRDAMSRRMPEWCEVDRLTTMAYGHYYKERLNGEKFSFLEFLQTGKRPYGNKDKPASIAYSLGWDWNRHLCQVAVPKDIQEEAMRLHAIVIQNVKQEIEDERRDRKGY